MSAFRFADVFRFAGDDEPESKSAKILQELRAEALAYGFWLEFNVWPDGIPVSRQEGTGAHRKNLPIDKAFPKPAREILYELLSKHYLRLCDAVNAERCARGQKLIGDTAMLRKRHDNFERAYYGKFRHSEKARAAVDLLRAWHGSRIMEEHRPVKRIESEFIALFKPLTNAVESLDVEFLKLLPQAAQMLDARIRSSKDSSIGTGDTDLDLWLLQYGLRIAGTPTHTVRELNEQFVSKFRSILDAKLRAKCHKLGIPLKEDVRGAGAVRRKMRSNGTRSAEKKTNRLD
jgi:hypothetical protein